jgi:hypothetical protein
MITTIFALLLSTPAAAQVIDPGEALMLNLGMWSTDGSFCGTGAQCVSVTNISYTECVAFGFSQGPAQLLLGNTVVMMGDVATNVVASNGRVLTYEGCLGPRETVRGPLPIDWTDIKVNSIKYYVGDVRKKTLDKLSYTIVVANPLDPSTPLTGIVYGQRYAGTGQEMPSRSRPGSSTNYYDLSEDLSLVVGGN